MLLCLGFATKEGKNLTVLSYAPFLGATTLPLLGQKERAQFLAVGTNVGSLACRKCSC